MRERLDIKLFSQAFQSNLNKDFQLENAKYVAQMYSKLENCISVLSDLKARESYIYYSIVADKIGLTSKPTEIKSIWEDELLSKVHPEDLQKKYRLELQFFNTINNLDVAERTNYQLITRLRIKDSTGKYILIKHRLLYISSSDDGSVWLALCLYDVICAHPEFIIPDGVIINTLTGKVIEHDEQKFSNIISEREREILNLIKLGYRSKEIADKLTLSINTINRHRQNIFNKLNVNNALEACRIAETTGLL
ncbi:LuxR C-terminal-related transcriptional regulator [Pedobacter aquatilis]|uniref:response regulator transcription factor n=1 Tax=Pedobacter aquatilis TaxID=351343 RepID=UPI0025B58A5F|nr:LuxR C-terminal-related transcriptional regulator [Pedobacter aquatilis]MDN3587854.1 LuxR C-terminal-related transcriptional regulator [Pedobacter aquatilis]